MAAIAPFIRSRTESRALAMSPKPETSSPLRADARGARPAQGPPPLDLADSVQYVKGVGPRRLVILRRLGIETLGDLLYHLPREYEDLSQIKHVADLRAGERTTIRARVLGSERFRARSGRAMFRVYVTDGTDTLMLVWFNTRYVKESDFPVGEEMYFTGKVDFYRQAQMVSPVCERAGEEALYAGRIVPQYPLTEGLSQRALRNIMRQALDRYAPLIIDHFDRPFLKQRGFMSLSQALRAVHFPDSMATATDARRRLAYDEFFFLELGMALRKRGIKDERKGCAFRLTPKIDARIRARIPFQLTRAQERVVAEMQEDMRSPKPMNRILQGDVGSGKTVCALYALLAAIADRYQAAIMAPTEVLADQHYRKFSRYLAGSRVRIVLLVGGVSRRERRERLEAIEQGQADLIIGTHALIQAGVEFKRLGLVVVDEQHKFGVLQRQNLRQKGKHPDVLVMTATPIPRTLSLTVFGDLDVSVLDEMPPGRKPVRTRWVDRSRTRQAFEFIRGRLANGEQAFIVYPLVEESEKLDLQAATERAAYLQREVFPEFRVGLLHGRMTSENKQKVMAEFRAGRYHILVSTIVIEVGIDVPNASIMVVEHGERYGLAQLHQLRGRIGRGDHDSWFLVFGDPRSDDARRRLQIIQSTSDGFRIAEEDLRIRGPGQFFGTRQHGLPEIRVGNILHDYRLLRIARQDAFRIVADDPDLGKADNAEIRRLLLTKFKDRLDLINVG